MLGLPGKDAVDILNVKVSDPIPAGLPVRRPGYTLEYHNARGNWISLPMDGSVPLEELCHWLNEQA